MKLDPNSEMAKSAADIQADATKCATVADLARMRRWSMETARHANQALELGLREAALRPGPRIEARAIPKPVKRK
jgi:hypothetical protein